MRSFTKKNVPYNSSVYHLLYSANANITALRTALNNNQFKQAAIQLVNLTNDAAVNNFVNAHRNTIKNVYVALNGLPIGGPATVANFMQAPPGGNFQGMLPNVTWPNVNVAGDIMPALNNIQPSNATVNTSLTGGAANNNMDISTLAAPYNINGVIVNNISVLVVLQQFLRYARIRSEYENLWSFDYHANDGGGRVVRINHFYYNHDLIGSNQTQHSNAYTANSHLLNLINRNPTGANIVMGQLGAIVATAPNHVRFTDVGASRAQWVRQGMGNLYAPSYILLPIAEAKYLAAAYINQATPLVTGAGAFLAFGALTAPQQQGVMLLNYIQRHSADSLKKIKNNNNVGGDPGRGYRLAKLPLVKAQGLYCAFCESPLVDGRNGDIEHKLPKSVYPTEALDWENLVLACKVCNSDNKGTRFVDHTHAVNGGAQDFTAFHFNPGAGKNYINYRNGSREETLWPDRKHPAAPAIAHNMLSFQAVDYLTVHSPGGVVVPVAIGLNNIDLNTQAFAHIANLGAGNTYQVDILDLVGMVNQLNVRTNMFNIAGAPANVGGQGIQASTDHIRTICGLNDIGANFWSDQRVVRRTKTWLCAMQQLKILSQFHTTRFGELQQYYDRQLHPAKIKNNPGAPNHNNIDSLRDDTPAAIVLDDITGQISVAANISNGKVSINLAVSNATTNPGGGGTQVDITAAGPAVTNITNGTIINMGTLTGRVTEVGPNRTMTGSIKISDLGGAATPADKAALNNKIILFKDAAVITNPPANPTMITIAANQGVISNSAAPAIVNLLKTWDTNRADVLRFLDSAGAVLLDYIWNNILNMVRKGGFYSTWVRTFHHNRPNIGGNPVSYDIDLVRRLEMKAQENPGDPFQFHGTDAAEIINSL